jgi:hypothetical protein
VLVYSSDYDGGDDTYEALARSDYNSTSDNRTTYEALARSDYNSTSDNRTTYEALARS